MPWSKPVLLRRYTGERHQTSEPWISLPPEPTEIPQIDIFRQTVRPCHFFIICLIVTTNAAGTRFANGCELTLAL